MSQDDHGAATRGAARDSHCRGNAAVRVLSIDSRLSRALAAPGFHGRVHSVFDHVVNLSAGDGELFTLACRSIDNAPLTAILDLENFGASGIAIDLPVFLVAGHLRIGDALAVSMAGARWWDCLLPSWPAAVDVLEANLPLARDRLQRHRTTLRETMSTFDAAALELLELRARDLRQALAARDIELAGVHARSVVGLGPGLTPSGDDFLVGLLASFNLPGSPCWQWLGDGSGLLAWVRRSTNAISVAALEQAAQGRVRESIAALLEQLLQGPQEHIDAFLEPVLSIGSSSGCDIVAGLLCGLETNLIHARAAS